MDWASSIGQHIQTIAALEAEVSNLKASEQQHVMEKAQFIQAIHTLDGRIVNLEGMLSQVQAAQKVAHSQLAAAQGSMLSMDSSPATNTHNLSALCFGKAPEYEQQWLCNMHAQTPSLVRAVSSQRT